MAGYIGNKQKISGRYTVDEFTSSGGTTYTLTKAPGAKNNMQVSAGGLVQYPSAYSYSGTTLTLSGVPSGQKVLVRHMGDTISFPLGPTVGTVQATTSGGFKTFSNIPSGTTNIIISWNEVSADTNGASMEVRLGHAGGIESTGYISTACVLTNGGSVVAVNSTTGFLVRIADASFILSGQMTLTLPDASANTWISSYSGKVDTTTVVTGSGSKSLSAELTQLSIVLTAGDYDSGSVNIMYW